MIKFQFIRKHIWYYIAWIIGLFLILLAVRDLFYPTGEPIMGSHYMDATISLILAVFVIHRRKEF